LWVSDTLREGGGAAACACERTKELTSTPSTSESGQKSQSFSLAVIVKQLRPKQWVKNLIVFAPLLFSGKFSDAGALSAAALCCIAFCSISSGIYVINDLHDLEADRAHPRKRFRPIAAGVISVARAWVLSLVCLAAGMGVAFYVRPTLSLVCCAYVALNIAYSYLLKKWVIIDVLCIAFGFVLRAVAGAVAVHVPASGWFLLCTTLGALFLALEKRRHEVSLLAEQSASHRSVLSEYSVTLLSRLENLIAPSLLTAYIFYSFQSFHGQWMLLTVPIVLYGVMRYQYLSETGHVTGAPEEVLWRDRPIQLTLILWVATCALVVYGHPDQWLHELARSMDSMHI
jgi:4-hydroxybenzoate polyprenyltransferase